MGEIFKFLAITGSDWEPGTQMTLVFCWKRPYFGGHDLQNIEVIGVPGASPIGFDQHISGDCGLFFFFGSFAVVRKHDEFVKQPYLTR